MSKSKYKYKVYNGRIIKEMLDNSRILIFVVIFAIGIIIGAKVINSDNLIMQEQIKNLLNSFTIKRAGQGVINNFSESLFSVSVFSLATVFLGFSLIGYPLIIMIPLLRGMGIGAVCGYLYSVYKFTGLGYSLLMIYPGALFSTLSLLLMCNDCCEYSKNAYSKAILGRGQFEKDETRVFLIRQLIFVLIGIFGALTDAVCSKLFVGLFNL